MADGLEDLPLDQFLSPATYQPEAIDYTLQPSPESDAVRWILLRIHRTAEPAPAPGVCTLTTHLCLHSILPVRLRRIRGILNDEPSIMDQ